MAPSLRRRQRQLPGLHRAIVVNDSDPQQSRRVQVRVPSVSGSATPWAVTVRDVGRPRVGDEVLVGFEAGDPNSPYVVGVLASSGSSEVELSDDNGNSVRLTSSGIEITSGAEVRINASTIRFVSASGAVDAGMWSFSGVVKSATLITDSVVAASYSPGAGNVM